MNLKALMALRAGKVAEMQSLLDGATAENRELTAEELAKYDALMAEQDKLKGLIARAEAQEKLNAEMNMATTTPIHAPVVVSI